VETSKRGLRKNGKQKTDRLGVIYHTTTLSFLSLGLCLGFGYALSFALLWALLWAGALLGLRFRIGWGLSIITPPPYPFCV